MTISPLERDGRDPEVELRRLNRRLRRVSRRIERPQMLCRAYRRARMAALALIGVAALYLGLAYLSPWPPLVTLRHLAAFPSCDAALAVGLAPAVVGQPGYWRRNDRDGDGIACEVWPQGG